MSERKDDDKNRDRGAAVIGGLALAGLGSALLWLLWSSREPDLAARTRQRLR